MLNQLKTVLEKLAFYPKPIRIHLARKFLEQLRFIPYAKRLQYDAVDRPHYGYCIFNAAALAKALNRKKMSVLEFGVAGGSGLLNIEHHVRQIKNELDIEFEVYGFDSGSGLPPPSDYRDLPYHWSQGFFTMDPEALQKRLEFSQLVMGDVKQTALSFIGKYHPAPIGCVFFDLDYYSSTKEALKIFDDDPTHYLPRVYCYFDDTIDDGVPLYNEYTGELLAIREFNENNSDRKITRISGLSSARRIQSIWNDKIFILHDFKHPDYNSFVSTANQQRPLVLPKTEK